MKRPNCDDIVNSVFSDSFLLMRERPSFQEFLFFVTPLAVSAIELMGKKLTGPQKKEMVIKAVEEVAKRLGYDDVAENIEKVDKYIEQSLKILKKGAQAFRKHGLSCCK